ncbi:uncharacterized protein LOC126661027 [Mercurialis annua]|uniref:uncharacterized protein LOC126661027 n=1 Tax=Mercurialis annua TaxID=3986 RepID=UPI00215E6511|nr:uncharacterized protein LOC126661027 [Mercurialis annua]
MTTAIKIPSEAILSTILQQLKLPSQKYEFDVTTKVCHVYFSYEHPISKTMVNEVCVARVDTTDFEDAKERVSGLAIEFLRANYGMEIIDYSSIEIRKMNNVLDVLSRKNKAIKKECKRLARAIKIMERML